MHTFMSNESKWGARLRGFVAVLALACCGVAAAATLPAATGALVGTTRTFDLWAKTGATILPGPATVAVWGYTDSASGTVTAPGGPMLIVNQGETVVVNLTNNLVDATAMLFQGQAMVPDLTGATAGGGTKAYTFTASSPGTFLYEAGLLPNAQHQAAMGLYGALIVRPTSDGAATGAPILTQAYADAATAFVDEGLLVLGEIDPALAASPATFDMRNYAPKYFLINGKAYPDTSPIVSAATNKVLLRYVNAGIQHHSMAVLGLRQNFVAKGAGLLPTLNHNVVAETLAPGQTGDAIATVPATGSRFAVYDGSLKLHNNGASNAFGGMLTFVSSGAGTPVPGPLVTALSISPDLSPLLTATITASIGRTVQAAEYWIDAITTTNPATAITGTFGTQSVTVTANIPTPPSGNHTVYVRGQDNLGTWGAPRSVPLVVDTSGPITSGLTLTPNPSNGKVSIALHATGDDTTTGGSNVTAAEYFIGTAPANTTRGTALNVNVAAPAASLDGTITCTTLAPCAGGAINVRSKDEKGNWGAFATIALNVVAFGPDTSGVTVARTPNNGALPLTASQPVVRVTANLTADALTTVSAAEGFIDTVGAPGTGFVFVPSDGNWTTASENAYADIPLATINALSAGNHTIYVRGKDAVGNWGGTNTAGLFIDKTAPTFTSATLSPTTAIVGETVTLTVNGAADTGGAGLGGNQYWIDGTATPPANPTAFTGTSTTFSVLTGGVHTVYVRVGDLAGNWSTVSSLTLTVPSAVNDAVTFAANNNATQTNNQAAPGVLGNDLPIGAAGRTATLVTAPVRTAGTGTGTITVTCPTAIDPNATAVCPNGRYLVTLTGVGATGALRAASKRGTYQFTYTETLNGKTTPAATVTITVN